MKNGAGAQPSGPRPASFAARLSQVVVVAALLAGIIVGLAFRGGVAGMGPLYLWLYLFLATASHGVLDAMTDGGLGVAFFAPFDNQRYFLPWRPIRVSPISIGRFFSERGIAVIRSEMLAIWVPSMLIAALGWALRRRQAVEGSPTSPRGNPL